MLSLVFPTLISSPRTALCLHVCECVRVSLHACTLCRLKSQTGSTSLIPLSRFTAMLMWDLHQNGWCTAQTEPMSQLESLRNGSTHTHTHTHTHKHTQTHRLTHGETHNPFSHTICVSHYLSLSDTSAYSQSFWGSLTYTHTHTHATCKHTHFCTHSHTHTHTHKHTPLPLGTVPLAFAAGGEKNAETVEMEKESGSETRERASEKEREWSSIPSSSRRTRHSSEPQNATKVSFGCGWLFVSAAHFHSETDFMI